MAEAKTRYSERNSTKRSPNSIDPLFPCQCNFYCCVFQIFTVCYIFKDLQAMPVLRFCPVLQNDTDQNLFRLTPFSTPSNNTFH
jgi:hypothetical protein